MAELHAKNSHPLDELKEALANVIEDLAKKL
jgi:predicted small metal-binding protein